MGDPLHKAEIPKGYTFTTEQEMNSPHRERQQKNLACFHLGSGEERMRNTSSKELNYKLGLIQVVKVYMTRVAQIFSI